jgi:tetratricopeptide (TPR) repeat protein
VIEHFYGLLAANQPLREPDPAEREEMSQLGATSFEAYHIYKNVVAQDFSAVMIDPEWTDHELRRVLALEPRWAHAFVELVDGAGIATPRGQEILAEAKRTLAGQTQDPLGQRMLDAMALTVQGRHTEAAALLDPEFRQHPDDIDLGWILARRIFHAAGRTQDAISVFQQLHQRRPELQFGANLIDELRRAGRGREVPAVVAAWLEIAPESEDARAVQVVVDLEAGRVADAVRQAREQVFLHGEAPHRLATLCDVLITAGENSEASRLAESMLRGSGPIRSRGWVRLGTIATVEGRFSAALEEFESAIAEGKSYPGQSGLRVAYESVRWLAAKLGRLDDAERYTAELSQFYKSSGMAWQAAAVDFERRLLRAKRGACPDREQVLRAIPDGPGRRLARIQMLRSAAGVGCASCAEVIREGISVDEWSQQSLYQFGECAAAEGALDLARDAYLRARATHGTSTDSGAASSQVHAVLSRLGLAKTLDRLGKRDEARVEYERFLALWGHADRSLPEVDEARKALARLSPTH